MGSPPQCTRVITTDGLFSAEHPGIDSLHRVSVTQRQLSEVGLPVAAAGTQTGIQRLG